MTVLNEYKKVTFEDKFWRDFACCKANHNEVWAYWKRKTRRDYRRYTKAALLKEINELFNLLPSYQ